MDIIEAIEARTSVRTFDGRPLGVDAVEAINAAMSCATCPLPGEWGMDIQRFDMRGSMKPGTYGVIKGASDFMLLGFDDRDFNNAVAAGFAMEQVVIACTQMGLGTCWIAGTFKEGDFARVAHFPGDMTLQVVIPVGVSAGERRFLEHFTRFTLGSKNRKAPDKLFFVGDWNSPLTDSSQYYVSLMMLRLAPSSTNSQPWRAIVKGDTVHFYTTKTDKVHGVDMGIGMSHFDMTERYRNYTGTWSQDAAKAPDAPSGLTYVASYRRD